MISGECLREYGRQYPNDDCGYEESSASGLVSLSNEKGKMVIQKDKNETDEIFMDRLKRSKACGRNLFFEEWKPFEYLPNRDY